MDTEHVAALVDMPGGKCSLLVAGRQVIVAAAVRDVAKVVAGRVPGSRKAWQSRKAKVIDVPELEGQKLGDVS